MNLIKLTLKITRRLIIEGILLSEMGFKPTPCIEGKNSYTTNIGKFQQLILAPYTARPSGHVQIFAKPNFY